MKLLSAVFCLTKISYQEPLQEPLQVPRQVLLEDDCSMSAYSEDDYSGTVWHTNFEDCWGICGAKGGACNVEGCDGFCCSKSKIDLNGDCPASAIQFLLTTQHSPAHTCVVPEVNQHGFNQRKHGYYDDPLVTGGHEPQPHSYPFVAMMLYHEGFLDHPERKCGGSILNENWILTSAQCCKDLPENERISFRIGAHRDEDCDFKFCANKISEYGRYSGANDIGTGIYVKNKLIHPDFKQVYEKCYPHKLRALQNDFCLIETKTTMKFGRHVQKISIADEDFFTEGW